MNLDQNFVGQGLLRNIPLLKEHVHDLRSIQSALLKVYPDECGLPWNDTIALSAAILEFQPELVIELGRAWGTSTALFRYWKVPVLSICRSNLWTQFTVPALASIGPKLDWEHEVNAIVGDIAEQD